MATSDLRELILSSLHLPVHMRWRFALPVPVSAQAATIIIDGDTIVRIRIVQIDTPETFGPRCENELILGLKAKKRLRELLDSGTVPRKHHGGFSDEARDCDRDIDGIAGPVRGLAGTQPQSKPLSRGPRSPGPPTPSASGLDHQPRVGLILAGSPRARRSLMFG